MCYYTEQDSKVSLKKTKGKSSSGVSFVRGDGVL